MADNNTEKQRVQELTDKLEQGLQDLFNSDSYRNYLSTMSKFHNYSFNNTLLIAMQKPEASLVAGRMPRSTRPPPEEQLSISSPGCAAFRSVKMRYTASVCWCTAGRPVLSMR